MAYDTGHRGQPEWVDRVRVSRAGRHRGQTICRDLVRVFKGTAFYDSLESVFKKFRTSLPPKTLSFLERIQSSYHIGIKPYKEYGYFREILNQTNEAILNNRRIEIIYHPLRRKEDTIRKVDPYKVWFFEGTMYLIGFAICGARCACSSCTAIRSL